MTAVEGKIYIKQLQDEIKECNIKIGQLSRKLTKQDDDIVHLREELRTLLTELATTKVTLKDIFKKM
jgi:chromosome segregation ATPase